jgi:hypothetical protein
MFHTNSHAYYSFLKSAVFAIISFKYPHIHTKWLSFKIMVLRDEPRSINPVMDLIGFYKIRQNTHRNLWIGIASDSDGWDLVATNFISSLFMITRWRFYNAIGSDRNRLWEWSTWEVLYDLRSQMSRTKTVELFALQEGDDTASFLGY